LGPLQYSVFCGSAQEATTPTRRFRPRVCLLKGCERSFRPDHPRCHFCSDACRRKAKKWRAWRAARAWRSSDRGKECRRAQSRRYRQLIPLVVLTLPVADPEPAAAPPPPPAPAEPAPAELPPAEAREGQRIATILEDLLVRACLRPGCYELFSVPTEYSLKQFCCTACRKALGRVREREGRYQRRRRAGVRPRCRRSRPTPKPRQ
jgi:hypothetical protein